MAEVREIWICSICENNLDRPKMFLPCYHTFCYGCLRKLSANNSFIKCPRIECDNQTLVSVSEIRQMPDNFFLGKLAQIKTKKPQCKLHNHSIRAFCKDCKELACHTCSMVKHNKHEFMEISDAESMMRQNLSDVIKCKEKSLKEVDYKLNKTDAQLKVFHAKFATLQNAIRQNGEKLKKLIDEKVNELLNESEATKSKNLDQINPIKNVFLENKNNLENFFKDSQELLKNGTPSMIISNVPKLISESNDIKEPDYSKLDVNFEIKFYPKNLKKEDIIGSLIKSEMDADDDKNQQPVLRIKKLKAIQQKNYVQSCFLYQSSFYCGTFSSNYINIYDANDFKFKLIFLVAAMKDPQSMVATCNNLFISESHSSSTTIHKVDLSTYKSVEWHYSSFCSKLSLTDEDNLLMTCVSPNVILEIDLYGKILRSIWLDISLEEPRHALKLNDDLYALCHQGKWHRVCLVDKTGSPVKSIGGKEGCSISSFHNPSHLIKCSGDDLLVFDSSNARIVVLSLKSLNYKREIKFDPSYFNLKVFGSLNEAEDRLAVASNSSYVVHIFSYKGLD